MFSLVGPGRKDKPSGVEVFVTETGVHIHTYTVLSATERSCSVLAQALWKMPHQLARSPGQQHGSCWTAASPGIASNRIFLAVSLATNSRRQRSKLACTVCRGQGTKRRPMLCRVLFCQSSAFRSEQKPG